MLGLKGLSRSWQWKAAGKHPAAADYINPHGGTPLMEAMAEWVVKGYEEFQRQRPAAHAHCSWRFWLRGAQKGSLICGVGKDSSDRIGRPFPLLIVGEGPMKGWEKQWLQLPLALSKVWARMERIAAQRYDDLQTMVHEVEQLAPPSPEDLNFASVNGGQGLGNREEKLSTCRRELVDHGRAMVAINDSSQPDLDAAATQWHGLLDRCCSEIPRAVFLGGTGQGAYLAVIQQPLSTADFVRLWSPQV
ncbi:MAG: type VI secretion system-associated protein TagF [Desulfobacteraceae bacterium]|nr:type VI secretion system-associated protein TagF [Desulfobacteraceae bacterium]